MLKWRFLPNSISSEAGSYRGGKLSSDEILHLNFTRTLHNASNHMTEIKYLKLRRNLISVQINTLQF